MCLLKEIRAKRIFTQALAGAGEIGNILSITCNKLLNDDVIYEDLSDVEVINKINEKIYKLIDLTKSNLDKVKLQISIELNEDTDSLDNSDEIMTKDNLVNDNVTNNEDIKIQNAVMLNTCDDKICLEKASETCDKSIQSFVHLKTFPTNLQEFMQKHSVSKIYNHDGQLLCQTEDIGKNNYKIFTNNVKSNKSNKTISQTRFEAFRKIRIEKLRQNLHHSTDSDEDSDSNLMLSNIKELKNANELNMENNMGFISDLSSDNSSSDALDCNLTENGSYNDSNSSNDNICYKNSNKLKKYVAGRYKRNEQSKTKKHKNVLKDRSNFVSNSKNNEYSLNKCSQNTMNLECPVKIPLKGNKSDLNRSDIAGINTANKNMNDSVINITLSNDGNNFSESSIAFKNQNNISINEDISKNEDNSIEIIEDSDNDECRNSSDDSDVRIIKLLSDDSDSLSSEDEEMRNIDNKRKLSYNTDSSDFKSAIRNNKRVNIEEV